MADVSRRGQSRGDGCLPFWITTQIRSGSARLAVTALSLALLSSCGATRGHGPMLGPRPPVPALHSPNAQPAWANPDRPEGALRGANLVPVLRRWLRVHPRPSGQVASYWEVEAHLRLGEALQLGSAAPHEWQAEYQWVLDHTLPRSPQASRARANLRLEHRGTFTFPGLIYRSAWNAAPSQPSKMDAHQGPWEWITVHHSAMEIDSTSSIPRSQGRSEVLRIQTSHVRGRGYGDVGYHFLIDRDGHVYEGRSLAWRGAHAHGENNLGNIGICLLGNFEYERPTSASKAALHNLIAALQQSYGIGNTHVVGHSHWKATQCPGHHLLPALKRYQQVP